LENPLINTLSTVNDMLGLLGELPINDLDAFHPVVPKATSVIATTNAVVQGDAWWFNTETITLSPQAITKDILLPADTLSVDSVASIPHVAQRGPRLYNLDTASIEFDKPVAVVLRRLIPFEDLPHNARAYVRARALLAFQNTIDGDAVKSREIKDEVNNTYAVLNSEHIRNRKVNMLTRPGVARILNNMRGARHGYNF
jgi:hypothetical protein